MSAWLALGSAFGGAIGATLGWTVSSFVGAPVRKFFDLRGEVIRRLTEFANVKARWKEISDDVGATSGQLEDMQLSEVEITRLEYAQDVLRDLAAQMQAFAENEPLALWLVRLRYDPAGASKGLIGLSNTFDTYGGSKHFQRTTLETALRIKL
jgi:hypothetical protein